MALLPSQDWLARAAHHAESLRPWTEDRIARQSLGTKHPVRDFLFTYYSLSPGKLLAWHPEPEDQLEAVDAPPAHFSLPPYHIRDGVILRNPALFHAATRERVQRVRTLCETIALRPPRHQCAGLHEWAMVHELEPEAIRHSAWPLRMAPDDLAAFVRSQNIICTHYDAYRFFTPAAAPLNVRALTPEDRLRSDQPGCIHANMDLYKCAFKLLPWLGSDLLRATFLLAAEAREVDMRASPYDLSALGFAPIPIETPAGRSEYETAQREIAAKGRPLRAAIIQACDRILDLNSAAHV